MGAICRLYRGAEVFHDWTTACWVNSKTGCLLKARKERKRKKKGREDQAMTPICMKIIKKIIFSQVNLCSLE